MVGRPDWRPLASARPKAVRPRSRGRPTRTPQTRECGPGPHPPARGKLGCSSPTERPHAPNGRFGRTVPLRGLKRLPIASATTPRRHPHVPLGGAARSRKRKGCHRSCGQACARAAACCACVCCAVCSAMSPHSPKGAGAGGPCKPELPPPLWHIRAWG